MRTQPLTKQEKDILGKYYTTVNMGTLGPVPIADVKVINNIYTRLTGETIYGTLSCGKCVYDRLLTIYNYGKKTN